MRILVTAFDAFGTDTVNPSALAVAALPQEVAGAEIITAQLQTAFSLAADQAKQLIAQHQPDAVVCVGQAGGRAKLTPERVAINLIDARIPDNAGNQPVDVPIVAAAPAAYFATLPVKSMVLAAEAVGVPAELSHSAGTFVCNELMYSVLQHLDASGNSQIRAGFVHVPYLPEQLAADSTLPAMPLAEIVRGLIAMIGVIAGGAPDVTGQSQGALH